MAGVAALTMSSTLTVDTNTFFVDATNNRVGIRTTSPLDNLFILNNVNGQGGMSIANNGAGNSSQSVINLISFFPDPTSILSATNKVWQIAARGNAYNSPASEANDLAVLFNDGATVRTAFILDSATGNTTFSNTAITTTQNAIQLGPFNTTAGNTGEERFMELAANGSNYVGFKAPDSIATNTVWTLPSSGGTNGYALTTNGTGALSWSNVGGANDVSNPSISTDNAVARFDGATGLLIQNSGVIIDDSNNVTGISTLTVSGNMNVDSGTLYVDAANNRVGIGKTNPTVPLDVTGTVKFGGSLDMTSNQIANVANPSSNQDAMTLVYGSTGRSIFGRFNPIYQNANATAANDPQTMVTANANGIYSSNANYNATQFLPATGYVASGTPFYFRTDATLNVTVSKNRTNLASDIVLTTGQIAIFIYNSANTTYEYQGTFTHSSLTPILTFNSLGNSYSFPTGRGTNGQVLTTDGAGSLSWVTNAGGDVTGPAASTDTAIARFNGATGKIIQNSGVNIDNNGSMTFQAGQFIRFPHANQTNTDDGKIGSRIFSEGFNIVGTQTSAGAGRKTQLWGSLNIVSGSGTDTGDLQTSGQISSGATTITTGAVDWGSGNIISTSYNCAAAITFANLKIGGTYTLAVTDTGITQCTFDTNTTGTNAATVTYRFRPANTVRVANTHTLYTLMRVGNTVYVSWGSNF